MSLQSSDTPTITLHWLEASRAQRILWLLEELKIEYKLKLYHRIHSLADPALKKVFPLGKSPIIEIDYHDGEETTKITESGHIVSFLIKNFDKNGVFSHLTEKEKEQVDFFLHFAEGSLQPYFLILVVHQASLKRAPFLIRPIVSKFLQTVDTSFTLKNVKDLLDYLESVLAKNAVGLSADAPLYFVNNKFSGADVILVFNIYIVLEGDRLDSSVVDTQKYPYLKRWFEQIKTRPALLRAEEKAKTEGAGKFIVNAL